MKIQINNLEALERLIGNDNELEMEVRRNIVENFSKKYLKSLVEGFEYKDLNQTILKIFRDKYCEKSGYQWEISSEMKLVIKEAIDKQINTFISSEITKAFTELREKALLSKRLDKYTQEYFDKVVQEQVRKRIDKLISE